MHDLLILHAAITWALAGLIWVVQILVYPQFLKVGPEAFAGFHASHMARITLVVGPLALMEAGTAAGLLWLGQRGDWFTASLWFLGANVVSTALVQAPLHGRLSVEYSVETIRRLVASNWIRTLAWTARGACMVMALRH
jgi:hypothetical protein